MKFLQNRWKGYAVGIIAVFVLAFNVYAEIDHGTDGVANTDIVTSIIQITPGDPADPEADVRDWIPCWGVNPWSYDGEWIVYQSQVGEATGSNGNEIAAIRPDGTEYQQVTYNDACDSHGNFTPNGKKIVFQRVNTEGYEEIWIIDTEGNEQNLTQAHGGSVSEGGEECKPIVSPDGTKIAFLTRYGDTPYGIWVMNIDGTNPVQVFENFDSWSAHHSWSPDSQWILFKAKKTYDSGIYCRLYKVRPDGTDLTMLSDDVDEDFAESWAEWSPNGVWISHRHRYSDTDLGYDVAQIRIMDSNGENKQTLVSYPAPDGNYSDDWLCGPHSWHPYSEWIAFKKWSDTSSGIEGTPAIHGY